MASPVVTNSDADLNGKTLLVSQTSASITGGLVPASDSVQVGWLWRAHTATPLTDAQIKALPTTPIQLVAAPGANLRLKVLSSSWVLNSTAGVYTNINATYAAVALAHTNATAYWLAQGPINDNTFTTPLADVTAWLGAAHSQVYDTVSPNLTAIQSAASGDRLWVLQSNATNPTRATVVNQPIKLSMDNNGSGALTGGNAANTLSITIWYVIEPI